jgi:cobalt-zinc-cadmium efflux system outer membrane protein
MPGVLHPTAVLFAALALVAGAAPATAQDAGLAAGATVESVLALGRQLSPELRAMALDRDAAAARADGAGRLDDPTFRAMSDEVDRTGGPRINKTYLSIEQEFPLWGKLDLRHAAALAAVDAARGREQASAAELDEKIKIAFARYYAASQALIVNRDVARLAGAMAKLARERYAQNLGAQTDAITAEAEITRTAIETARLEAERRSAAARLNALLARPPGAPLAEPKELRRLPPAEPRLVALLDRARAANPRLFAGAAEIRGAVNERELASKAWYPNVTLGAGAIQRDNGPPGYTATLAFKVPLQWGVKEAGEREAAAKLGAAQQRQRQLEAEISGDLEQALAALASARRIADLTRRQLIPTLDAAHNAALALYRRDQGTLTAVLEAEHRIHQARLDLLRAESEAQTALASIERLIGAEL